MADVFVHGTLCHPPLLAAILGHAPAGAEPAVLDGYRVRRAGAGSVLVPEAGAEAAGLLLRGLGDDDLARLVFHDGGREMGHLPVQAASGTVTALVPLGGGGADAAGGDWDMAAWVAAWGATVTATAADVMQLRGAHAPQAVRARSGPMLVRGSSRVRARAPSPARVRGTVTGVDVAARRTPYANFFAVEEYDLRFRRFDGSMSPVVTRAAFVSGDAVTVLPYDPVRDRVLLVEQFRTGPYARGDSQPWQLEPIAGRIDPDEAPEEAARREAEEEAGLHLGALLPVAGYYPSPGAKTEYLYSYVALADLPDGSAGVFGVEGEAEDIRGHLIPFGTLLDLVASGEAANAPLILTAFWLARERPRLRAEAGVTG